MKSNEMLTFDREKFGERFKSLMESAARRRELSRIDLEHEISRAIEFKRTRFPRWYDGTYAPSLQDLSLIIAEILKIDGVSVDIRNLLLGSSSAEQEIQRVTRAINSKLDAISNTVGRFDEYVQTHALGLDGVIMRLSMKLLHDLGDASKLLKSSEKEDHGASHILVAGYLSDRTVDDIEQCSPEIRFVSQNLNYEIEDYVVGIESAERGFRTEQRERPGLFLHRIALNLDEGVKYMFILAGEKKKLKQKARTFLQHLEDRVSRDKLTNITIRHTSLPLGAGFALYDVDLDRLGKVRHFLRQDIVDQYLDGSHIDARGHAWLGMVSSPSGRMRGSCLMDSDRTKNAVMAWEAYFTESTELLG